MSWIDKHPRAWRAGTLVLLFITLVGPWGFDLLNVPSEYTCSPPSVRLHDDFCGMPLSGIDMLTGTVEGLRAFAQTGAVFPASARDLFGLLFLCAVVIFVFVLPFFNTLLLILRGASRRRGIFSVVTWSLAASISLLMGTSRPRLFWALWGIWLYLWLAVSALTVEGLTLIARGTPARGDGSSRAEGTRKRRIEGVTRR
jgi:hypothetical protein